MQECRNAGIINNEENAECKECIELINMKEIKLIYRFGFFFSIFRKLGIFYN